MNAFCSLALPDVAGSKTVIRKFQDDVAMLGCKFLTKFTLLNTVAKINK